jgi:hypothetical protein
LPPINNLPPIKVARAKEEAAAKVYPEPTSV